MVNCGIFDTAIFTGGIILLRKRRRKVHIFNFIKTRRAVFPKGNAAFFYATKSPIKMDVYIYFHKIPLEYRARAPPRSSFEKKEGA